MTAGYFDWTIEQNSDANLQITWTDGAGNLVNLTGFSARLAIREEIGATSLIIELTSNDGEIILGGAAGTIHASIAAATTAALPIGECVYDLLLIDTAGGVIRLVQGKAIISAGVTL